MATNLTTELLETSFDREDSPVDEEPVHEIVHPVHIYCGQFKIKVEALSA